MDSSLKSKKFGVVHTSPSEMISSFKLEVGKLYFAQGDASGAAKQGVYALTNMVDVDGVTTPQLTMFGTGAIADGSGYGLSQYNFNLSYKNKLDGIAEGANKGVTNVSTGVGLLGGDITTSGTIKVNLVNENKNENDASATNGDNANRLYPVQLDKSGRLAVNVPWLAKAVGATDSSSKLFIIGALNQDNNPQTYSNASVYIDSDSNLYSNNKKVATIDDVGAATIYWETL